MSLKMSAPVASQILRSEADGAKVGSIDPAWQRKLEEFSQLCEDGASKTHVAFLGTAMLAKAVDPRADLRAIKPKLSPDNPNAYSARSLCHGVLVPISAELGFSLGVSGREPLNNQPYFRMTTLGDDTPVHAGGRKAFDRMIALVDELQAMSSGDARAALRAFIEVRRRFQRLYASASSDGAILTPGELLGAIQSLVGGASEGGRRAQAVAAGLLDVVAGSGRVESGRVNDPSRNYPGDVAVLAAEVAEGFPAVFEKAFEVRDKPVKLSDVALFGRTCRERGVQKAAMLLVSEAQLAVDPDEVVHWSEANGISMTMFVGWAEFVEQCLFWSSASRSAAAAMAVDTIRERLVGVEASVGAVTMWDDLTRGSTPSNSAQ